MRKIDINNFRIAGRSTSRDVNRQIALNLLREHEPLSRADLARLMNTTRGAVGALVSELIAEGLVYDGPRANAPRGRRPTLLYVRTQDRLVIAADVRVSGIDILLSDFAGNRIVFETLEPILSASQFVREFPRQVNLLLKKHGRTKQCEGIGIVIPGVADRDAGQVILAPLLGWRDIKIREPIARATGLPVVVESAGKACALAQMWLSQDSALNTQNFIYISISDGVGAGLVIEGRLVAGQGHTAGEFGHMPINLDGPRCACGSNGCWMVYISDIATSSRYASYLPKTSVTAPPPVGNVITLARSGDAKAISAIQSTGWYLGIGLATILHGLDPACVYIGGEITAAWDILESPMREALAARALTEKIAKAVIQPSKLSYPRLLGAVALLAAPTFAAPNLA